MNNNLNKNINQKSIEWQNIQNDRGREKQNYGGDHPRGGLRFPGSPWVLNKMFSSFPGHLFESIIQPYPRPIGKTLPIGSSAIHGEFCLPARPPDEVRLTAADHGSIATVDKEPIRF